MDHVDLVEGLFAAYGREANEAQIRSYVAVFKTGEAEAIAKAIVEASRGTFPKLPTAAEVLKLSQEIARYDRQVGERNQIEHNKLCGHYVKIATNENWTRAQKDQLIRICERAFDKRTKDWLWNRERLSEEIACLIHEVEQYRQAAEMAAARGAEPPDEESCSWGWAIPKPGEQDWDPQAETLWECVQRIRKNGASIR